MMPRRIAFMTTALLGGATALWMGVAARRAAAPRVERTSTRRIRPTVARPRRAAPDIQQAVDGYGPLLHRHYRIDLPSDVLDAKKLMRLLQRHLTTLSPKALAEFEATHGRHDRMREGDEYEITMLGPWNGRVRVHAVADRAFTLVTLDGHPEAGEIRFRVEEHAVRRHTWNARKRRVILRVSIESWARSRDRTVDLAYRGIKLGKHLQTEVWVTLLHRLAQLAGAQKAPVVRIASEEFVRD